MKATILIVLLLTVFGWPCLAQEKALSAEELLNWFPLDTYETIYHEETAALRAGKSYEVYKEFGGNSFISKQLPLPESMKEQLESFTGAQLVRLYVYVQEPGMGRQKLGSNKMMAMGVGETAYAVESVGEHIWVARLFDPIGVIKKALEAEELAETENRVRGQMVYGYQHKDRTGTEKSAYLCPMPTGELLIAASIALIERMAAAGLGEGMNVFGDPSLESFEGILPYAGQSVYWISFVPHHYAILKKAEKDGADAEDLSKAEKVVRRFPGYATSFDVSGKMIKRWIESYVDEETAEQAFNPNRMQRTSDPYSRVMLEVEKSTREGSMIINTIVYEEEVAGKIKAAREEARKYWAQQRKELEQKKEEEKKEKQ